MLLLRTMQIISLRKRKAPLVLEFEYMAYTRVFSKAKIDKMLIFENQEILLLLWTMQIISLRKRKVHLVLEF